MCGMMGNFPRGRVEGFPPGALVEVEPSGTCCDIVFLALQRGHVQVEEVTWGEAGCGLVYSMLSKWYLSMSGLGTAAQHCTPAGLGTAAQHCTPAGLGTAAQHCTPAGLGTAAQHCTPAGLGTAAQHCTPAGLGTAAQHRTPAGLGTAAQHCTSAGLGTAAQHCTPAGLGTAAQHCTPAGACMSNSCRVLTWTYKSYILVVHTKGFSSN